MKRCSTPMCGETGVCAECRPPEARTVVPGRAVSYHVVDANAEPARGEVRLFDPNHESLVARFDQLQRTLEDARSMAHVGKLVEQYVGAAIILATLIREQVVK